MNKTKNNKNNKNNKTKKHHCNVVNDFYTLVNNSWLNNIKIRKDKSHIDNFSIVNNRVSKQLSNIVIKSSNKNIQNLYKSFLSFNDKNTEQMYFDIINDINTIIHQSSLTHLMAFLNIYHFNSPIECYFMNDLQNPTKYITTFEGHGIILNTKLHYTNNKYSETRSKYLDFLNNLFSVMYGKNHNFNIQNILTIEKYIASYMVNIEDERNPDVYYNIFKSDDFKKYNFNICDFCNNYYIKNVPDKYIVTNPKLLKNVMQYLHKNWNNHFMYSYWISRVLIKIAPHHSKLRPIHFNFKRKYLLGIEDEKEKKEVAMNYSYMLMNTALSIEYLKNHIIKENITLTEKIIYDIRNIFHKRLSNNTWLSNETKNKAIQKLENMQFIVGYKKQYKCDSNISWLKNNRYKNIHMFRKWKHLKDLNKLKCNYDTNIWNDVNGNVYDVNAYYFPIQNMIIVPNGYLQKPFVDASKSYAYNMAYIGATIGHEITHGFDDEGSKYNQYGIYKTWWNKEDHEAYKIIQNKVEKIYDSYIKSVSNKKLNLKHSMGENIADIGGLLIAEEAVVNYCVTNKYSFSNTNTYLKSFYKYYTESWKSKTRYKALNEKELSNEHIDSIYRCNCPLMFSFQFQKIYKITEKSKMFNKDIPLIW
jgi:putative endopeptidase